MSTKPSPSASKMKGEKTESSLRRSSRVVGLPAEVEPKEAEKSEPSRSTLGVSALSAEVEASRPSDAEPSAEPEVPPIPEDGVPSLSSPKMKPSGASQGDEAGAQPSPRNYERRSQAVSAEPQNIVPQDEPTTSTAISRLPSANPEPTAANPRSSQVEGGALSLLGSREMKLREQSQAWTGTDPVWLNYAPGTGYFGSTSGGAWSSSLWPDQRRFQRLRSVPEGVEAQHLSLTRPPGMTEIDMTAYGRSQLELWMSLPSGVVHPIDVAYAPRHEGYDLWEFIRAAGTTARHLMSVTQTSAARWLNVFKAERRRIPVISDLKAVRVSLGLMPPIACVALLQTMLLEAEYEFQNQVPAWHTLSEVSSVSESQFRLEVELIGHFIRAELVAWKFAVGSAPNYVRSPSDSLLIDSVQTSESRVGFPLDKNGDAIVDENTQLFLGLEVAVRLQLTGLKPRSPASSLDGEPTRKRPLLIRASTGGSFPSWRISSDAASETRLDDMSDSVPSMVGAGPNYDPSLMAIGERGNMSYSSSGSSLMSVTDYMLGTGTHFPMSTATVMHGSVTGAIRSSVPGMAMSVTPDPPRTGPVRPRVGAGMYVADQLSQIPLPSSPESNRSAKRNVAAAETGPGLGRYHSGVRLETKHILFSDPVAPVDIYDSSSQRDSAQSEATAWAHCNAEQTRNATEARLQAVLDDYRTERVKLHEEYQKLQAMNAQMPDAQRRTQTEQRKQLEGLEILAEQRVAAESDKRKEDEVRDQWVLGVQKMFQEAEIKARQAELQRVHSERAAKIQAEYDVKLLRVKKEHAQAQATRQQAIAEREEKFRLLQSAHEQVNIQAGSRIQMSHSTRLLNSAGVPTEPLRVSTVIAPVLAKLDQLVDVMCQMVHANQRQAKPIESRDKTTTAQNLSQNNRTKSSAQISVSTSRRSSKACTSRSKTSDDNDWGSDSSSSSDSSQNELERKSGSAAQTKVSEVGSVVVQAMFPHSALEKFDERSPLDDRVNWWERFMYYAAMAPWDEMTRIGQLRMRLSGSLEIWCAQLPDSTRSNWKKLSHVFKKEWCRSIDSKAESLYSMEMHYSEKTRRLADNSDSEKPIDLVREPVRDGSKSQSLCAFAYVGPALPCWCDDNFKCMSSANQASDYPSLTEVEDSSSELEFENNVEFALTYGDRYGWWSDHVLVGGRPDTAMVHGAIFNRRTQIWMDTGAMTSIMSLDFARKLKLKLRRGYRLRVSGFGDVPKYATAKATIKLTLGVGVIYVMDIWVGNIGVGLDCLLGMDFMIAAGVRLCARKGVVRLPDEESLFLVDGIELDHVGFEVDVSPAETIRLQPGRSVILPVKYHQAEPDKTVEWAGRGDQWVTQFIYGSGRKPKAVKMVNISDQVARITQHTVVACLVENEHFPQGKCFVRPWSRKYREWSALAYAAEPSAEYLRLEELVARQAELRGPPAVERPIYTWPKKLLLAKRPSKKDDVQSAGPELKVSVYMVNTNPPAQPKCMLSQGRNTSIWPPLPPGDPLFMRTQPKLTTVTEVDEDSQSETKVAESILTSDDSALEVVSRMMAGGGTTTQGAQRELESVFKAEPLDSVPDRGHRLRESFTRCMRLESNFSDEAATTVYFHEGPELLNDLGGQLVTIPELNDPGPKANMTTADIGKPGVVIPEMEALVRTVLERHHSSFQGERNVVPDSVRAKRPPRKDGDELGGVDPRAPAYRMKALPQGQSEGVPRRIGQDDATQSWRSTSQTSVAPGDVSPELTRSDRAEEETEIAKDETENDPAGDESEPEVVSRVMVDEGTTTHGAQKELAKVFKDQPVDFAAKPVSQLKESPGRCMRLEIDLSDEAEATVYFYEGTKLLNGLRNELVVLLKQKDLSPKADLTTADIGETRVTTKAMEAQARAILGKHHDNFLEDGNAVPAPARRVVGDFNVDDVKPVARRFRSIRPEHLRKAYDQLEKHFQTERIEYSHSEWPSPIVIRMKKNGGDIGTCIDYRIALQLTKLTHYPLPLIDDLLIGFESVLWVLSLAVAKRLWAVPMTLWAKHISVLIDAFSGRRCYLV